MAGTVINPPQMNFRISAIVDRLLVHVRGGLRNDSNEFFKLCISLSRGIDYAVANKELPVKAPELPGLLKQVCQWRNDAALRAAIMVLLISLKGACRNGWFNEKDNDKLQNLSNEISSSFCSFRDMNSLENTFHHSISAVMSRFYPSIKMGETLAFLEAAPGYCAIMKDFDITMKEFSSNDKIYLFVAQIEDTETSSCIISPQQVNFLLNGRAVDGRTCVSKDPGPQTPTLVTHMLKLGTNLLQVVGQFNGKYIILVAFMSMVSNPSRPILPNYELPTAAAPDSDNDIIEGPSTASLNCPISFKRIKTPIKGQLCKHRQCFDYDNYVDINSRRPSWRCPHCSQSVCFTDIRVDRIMVKVLEEVGVNVSHVKISADGSWEAVNEGDDHTDKQQSKPSLHEQSTCSHVDILDLTEGENYINTTNFHQDIDQKPSPAQLQNLPNPINQIPTSTNIRNFAPGFQSIHLRNETSNAMVPPVPNLVSQGQSQIFASNNMQSNNVNGSYPTHSRHVTRIPIAVQALPARTSAESVSGNRHQQFDGFHTNPHQINHRVSPSQHMGPEEEFGGGYQYTSAHLSADQYNSHQYQHQHQHQSVQSPVQLSSQVHQGVVGPTNGLLSNQQTHHYTMAGAQQAVTNAHVNNQQTHHYAMSAAQQAATNGLLNNQQVHHYTMSAAQQGFQVSSWTPSGSSTPVASLQDHGDQTWRPTGRMRGSLSGQAYADALNQYMYLPTQTVQATRPPPLNTPRPVIPHHLQFLYANNRNMIGSQGSENCLVFDNTIGGGSGGFGFR